MPIIKRREVEETEVITVRLPQSVARLLDAYAKHVNGDRGYVVTEALRYVFSRDPEFAREHGLASPRRRRERTAAAERL
jgi:predicted transcriptional regulator